MTLPHTENGGTVRQWGTAGTVTRVPAVVHSGGSGARSGTTPRFGRCSAPTVRVLGVALVVTYLALVGWLTLRPQPVPWMYDTNLTVFASLRHDLDEGVWPATRSTLQSIGLLAPLGFLLPMLSARLSPSAVGSFLHTVCASAALSVGLCVLRSSLTGGMFNIDDVLFNSVGAAAAHLLVVPGTRRWLRRVRGEATDPAAGSVRQGWTEPGLWRASPSTPAAATVASALDSGRPSGTPAARPRQR